MLFARAFCSFYTANAVSTNASSCLLAFTYLMYVGTDDIVEPRAPVDHANFLPGSCAAFPRGWSEFCRSTYHGVGY